MELVPAGSLRGAALRDLALVCSCGSGPYGLAPLAGALRAAGYLSATEDLGQLLEDGASPTLRAELPGALCVRLLEVHAQVRFWPSDGYLSRTGSSAAPLSAADAFRRYGMPLLVQCLEDGEGRAEIPGEGGRRRRAKILRRMWFLLTPFFAPALAVIMVRQGFAGLVRRAGPQASVLERRVTFSDALAALISAALTSVVYVGVCWTWFAFRLPPSGGLLRVVVAVLVAGVVALPVQLVCAVLLCLLGWDLAQRAERRDARRRP